MPICPLTGLAFEHHELEKKQYERFGFPLPNIHPIARLAFRVSHGNNWSLYWTQDTRTGQKLLSCFDPKEGLSIVDHHYWTSDEFDTKEYGRAFDFSRGFFEQYFEMARGIPRANVTIVNCTNVEYANHVFSSKSCYLCFICFDSENVLYSFRVRQCRDSIYCINSRDCELCYRCLLCRECYDVQFSEFSHNCTASRFLSNCTNCVNCYQCVNLSNKQYCIKNVQYSKGDYEARMREIDLSSYDQLQKEYVFWNEFLAMQPIQAESNIQCEDSTGTSMKNCRSCIFCSNLSNSENCVNCYGNNQTESCDSSGEGSEQGIMNIGFLESQRIFYTMIAEHSYDIWYSQHVFQSHDCFGCLGVKKSAYCILNKEYSPEEYAHLKERIIEHMKKTGEWGRYFPPEYSPFFYDDTNVVGVLDSEFQDYRAVAQQMGLRTREVAEEGLHDVVPVSEMKDRCDEWGAVDLDVVWACEKSGRAFKITSQELRLYQRMRVCVPRLSWRTQFEVFAPLMYPLPHEAICAHCSKKIYSYIHPSKTTRNLLCDECFDEVRE